MIGLYAGVIEPGPGASGRYNYSRGLRMDSSVALTRLEAALPERTATRIQLLLAGRPTPIGPSFIWTGCARNRPRPSADRQFAGRAALRRRSVLHSKFLSDAVMRNPERILQVSSSGSFYRVLTAEEYAERLFEFLGKDRWASPSPSTWRASAAASSCASSCATCWASPRSRISPRKSPTSPTPCWMFAYRAHPRTSWPATASRACPTAACGFSVISLGKLGGQELNYSSDIDLMFVYAATATPKARRRISNKEFFKKVANQYTELLSTYTAEGMCYRVDLRLRPDGRLGEICISARGRPSRITRSRARDWEKQMLIKARVSAGEPSPARRCSISSSL